MNYDAATRQNSKLWHRKSSDEATGAAAKYVQCICYNTPRSLISVSLGGMSELLAGKVQGGPGNASRWLKLFNAAYSKKLGISVFPARG